MRAMPLWQLLCTDRISAHPRRPTDLRTRGQELGLAVDWLGVLPSDGEASVDVVSTVPPELPLTVVVMGRLR